MAKNKSKKISKRCPELDNIGHHDFEWSVLEQVTDTIPVGMVKEENDSFIEEEVTDVYTTFLVKCKHCGEFTLEKSHQNYGLLNDPAVEDLILTGGIQVAGFDPRPQELTEEAFNEMMGG